jgi:hypothetical protein
VAPRLMRVDLKASSRELERSLGMNATAVDELGVPSHPRAWLSSAGGVDGSPLPKSSSDGRTSIERSSPACEGDDELVVATRDAAPRRRRGRDCRRSDGMIGDTNPLEEYELHDRGLLEIPMISADLVLTNRVLAGQSLRTPRRAYWRTRHLHPRAAARRRDLASDAATIIERATC